MDKIISAIPQDNFLIEIVTSSGISETFDVKPYFGGSEFKELQDEARKRWRLLKLPVAPLFTSTG